MTTTPLGTNEHGDETHPSFGKIAITRVNSTPGARLFDSSIAHSQYVSLSISHATRQRDLHHDWIYPRGEIIEVNLSLAQWGEFVSSFGQGAGTSCTLTRIQGEVIPGAENASRLAQTAREVADAARVSTEEIAAASKAVSAGFEAKLGRREMGALINKLAYATQNVPSNMRFAADTLTEHAETVVSRAKADIEAMALHAAAANQITPESRPVLEIVSTPEGES